MPNTPVTRVRPTGRSSVEDCDPAPPGDPGRRRVTRKDRAEVVRLYELGLPARAVAEQIGMSKGCVLKVLKASGVMMRPQGSHGWSRQ